MKNRAALEKIFSESGVIPYTAANIALIGMGRKKIAETTYYRLRNEIIASNGHLKGGTPTTTQPPNPIPGKKVETKPKPLFKPPVTSAKPTTNVKPMPPVKPVVPVQKVAYGDGLLTLKDLINKVQLPNVVAVREVIQKLGGLQNFDTLFDLLQKLRT